MKRILFLFILFLGVSCTPQQESASGNNCDPGLRFDVITRSCITDTTPQLPIANTSQIDIEQDSAVSSHDILYSNFDGDKVSTCTISSSTGGLRGVLKAGGVIYQAASNNLNGIDFSLEIINDDFVLAGFENVNLIGNRIIVSIKEGQTTSNDIAASINADGIVGPLVNATVSESLVLQQSMSETSFQGAYCECVNGSCKAYVEPVDSYVGSSRLTYVLTDDDGDSDPQTLLVTVSDKDDAPVTQDIILSSTYNEDTFFTVDLFKGNGISDAYDDADDDLATSCSISNLSNISMLSTCTCSSSTGNCSASFIGDSNYYGSFSFDYTVTANGVTSNTSTITGTINSVNDLPTGTSVSHDVTEDGNGTSGTFSVLTFTLPEGSDVDHTNSDLVYQYVSDTIPAALDAASYTDSCLDGTNTRACTFNFPPEFNGYNNDTYTITYEVVDLSGGISASPYTISVRFLAVNDPPSNNVPGAINFTFEESPTADVNDTSSITWNSTLGGWNVDLTSYIGTDIEDDANSLALSYYLTTSTNPNGIVTTDGSASAGTLSHCMNLTGSDGPSDLSCLFTPTDANATMTAHSYYFTVVDSGGLFADNNYDGTDEAITFTIAVNGNSDLPSLCQVSKYSEKLNRYECGINDCIGDGAPGFSPVSHTTDNPLVYMDEQNGFCYKSTSTSAFTTERSAIPNYVVGEGESIIIDNIVLNEGGDNTEDTEAVYLNLRNSYITSSNDDLVKIENIQFAYDEDGDGNFDEDDNDVLDEVYQNTDAVEELSTTSSAAIGLGKLRITILPSTGETGTSTISFYVCDNLPSTPLADGSDCNDTQITFDVTVNPVSVSHGGWTKVKSAGVRSKITGSAIDQNFHCSYSLSKCDGGKPCFSSSSSTPDTEADLKGAIFKTTNGCYVASSVSSSGTTWTAINPFCGITETKNVSSNVRYNCTITGTDCQDASSNTVACSSVSPGYPSLTPLSTGSTYKDGNGVCYRAYTAGDITSWVPADLYQSDTTNNCDDTLNSASCIGEGAPDDLSLTADDGTVYYDYQSSISDSKRCWIRRSSNWVNYPSVNELTIAWDPFVLSGTGAITGYNVYRRKPGESFDYDNPININEVSIIENQFIDNGTYSRQPAIPNQVYYYEVRAVVNLGLSNFIELTPNSNINELRVISPPENQVFVHRWMVNKRTCELMNSTSNQDRDYACPYVGYGDVNVTARTPSESQLFGSDTVFDFEKDLLVNRNELGCPFTSIGCPNTQDGSCIGEGVPSDAIDGADGDYYYDRSAGTCYFKASGAWAAVNGGTDLDNNPAEQYGVGTASHLPPLSNIDITSATAQCGNIATPSISGVPSVSSYRLPDRLEQIAYSRWQLTNSFDDSDVAVIEEGFALNASSKCNSSNANGIDSGYVDGVLPLSGSRYSLPGTLSSSIRSVYTGSDQTKDCESMFGVQDAVGNVSEWATLGFALDKSTGSEIRMISPSGIVQSTTDGGVTSVFDNTDYSFNGDIGPCGDLDSDGSCESEVSPWLYETTSTYDAGYFLIPWGLPIADKFLTDNPTDGAVSYVAQVGSVGGITNNQLRDDILNVTTSSLSDGDSLWAITGGSYTSGGGAGVYHMGLVPNSTTSTEIGMRCVIQLDPTDYDD